MQHLANQNYTAWMPMHTGWRRRAGRWEVVRSPLFPRYVFVRPGSPEQSIGPIRSTVGVATLVRFGGQLAIASDSLIETLRDLEANLAGKAAVASAPFQPGDKVCVVDGPFAGIEGIVSGVAEERVAVLLHILGREKAVDFSLFELAQASGQ